MKIFTNSKLVISSQKTILEFLLSNHPLDCPVCDQGGECELQDLSFEYSSGMTNFNFKKRIQKDKDIGPLIYTNMTRCIHCTRCVRFGKEISYNKDFGIFYRGVNTNISNYLNDIVKSELSGNVIDICPVGALTSKPFKFSQRSWELNQYNAISIHDCVGSNLFMHINDNTSDKTVLRVVPRENDSINETWISNRDRFSYLSFNHTDRITDPLIKENNIWRKTSWEKAINFCISNNIKIENSAGFISSMSSIEEFFIFRDLFFIKNNKKINIDFRIRNKNFFDNVNNTNLTEDILSSVDNVYIIGSDISNDHPIISNWVRKFSLKDNKHVFCINFIKNKYNFLYKEYIFSINNFLEDFIKLMNEQLMQKKRKHLIIFSEDFINFPCISDIMFFLQNNKKLFFTFLYPGANNFSTINISNTEDLLKKQFNHYILFNIEPEFDSVYKNSFINSFKKSLFNIAFSVYNNDFIKQYTNVIFPLSLFIESNGTYKNIQGIYQKLKRIRNKKFNSLEGKEALIKFYQVFNKKNLYDINNNNIIHMYEKYNKNLLDEYDMYKNSYFSKNLIEKLQENELYLILKMHKYKIDIFTRRSQPLKYLSDKIKNIAYINKKTAQDMKIVNKQVITIKQNIFLIKNIIIYINNRISDKNILIFNGFYNINNLISYKKVTIIK